MRITSPHLSLLVDLTRREFKLRYLGSLLGSYWNLVHPLVMIAIYTIVFSRVMHSRLGSESGPYAYSLYLCSGLLAWNFFSETVNRGTVTLLENASFMKKLSFPPIVLFGATLCSASINFFISFGIFSAALLFLQPVAPHLYAAYLVVVALFGIMGTGLGMALGCLNVFMRDFQQLTSVIFQLWFWFTPIVYLYDALPELAKRLLVMNPAFPFLNSLHNLLYFQRAPTSLDLALMVFWTAASCFVGWFIYKKSIAYVRDHL